MNNRFVEECLVKMEKRFVEDCRIEMGVGKLLRGKILGRDGHGRNGNYFYREAGLHMLGVERADYVC
jgi:hypothetical protein